MTAAATVIAAANAAAEISGRSAYAPVLDRAELDANTMSDPALQKELFDLYFGHAAQAMLKMRKALADADRVTWTASAHGLKGTARTLGLMRLAETAAEAEAAGERGEIGMTPERVETLQRALTAASAAAHGHLAQTQG